MTVTGTGVGRDDIRHSADSRLQVVAGGASVLDFYQSAGLGSGGHALYLDDAVNLGGLYLGTVAAWGLGC